jgi:hypothetical protein
MRRISVIAIASVFALSLTGCSLLGGGEETASEGSASPESAAAPASPSATPEFENPTVAPDNKGEKTDGQNDKNKGKDAKDKDKKAAKNSPRGILPSDLISSTNPNQRVKSISRDRTDPFAMLSTMPDVSVSDAAIARQKSEAEQRQQEYEQARKEYQQALQAAAAQRPAERFTTRPSATPSGPIAARPPASATARPAAPPRPMQPQPDLARAVEVTGVVQVGDVPYAIVNAPNEPSSRYVRVGQRLSNGQVLVKRIDSNPLEPVVVLEQYGIPVNKSIGNSEKLS